MVEKKIIFSSLANNQTEFWINVSKKLKINYKSIIAFDNESTKKHAKKYLIDLTFKTDYINLLSFLRELEFLESVILINDINLNLLSPNNNNDEINNPIEKIEVKISTTFYGRP